MRRILDIVLASALLCACGVSCGPKKAAAPVASERVAFPKVSIPTICDTPEKRAEYLTMHFWDAFFALSGKTDSANILGVADAELEESLALFITSLDIVSEQTADRAMSKFFSLLERKQLSDTAAFHYLRMTEKVSHYLYDPNSPYRDEDLYLPFVKGMAASPCTREDMRPAYRYETENCSICRKGTVAPDFKVKTISGGIFTLHSIKAKRTLLFFSNPGCKACKEIIDQVQGSAGAQQAIANGDLAVVNVYIDEDLKAWREYEHNYPKTWHTGYDLAHVIRGERLFDVRAIPSIYLLDSDKKVLLKDAPIERVFKYLDRQSQNP